MSDDFASRTWLPEQKYELLSTDSGEIAFVDLAEAAGLLHDLTRHLEAPQQIVPRVAVIGTGISCSVGGDGAFFFQVRGAQDACHSVDIWCDEPADYELTWQQAGTVAVASGVLLVADPYLLHQYTVETFAGPLFMGGLWIEMRLPGRGHVVIERAMHPGSAPYDTPAIVRARWIP